MSAKRLNDLLNVQTESFWDTSEFQKTLQRKQSRTVIKFPIGDGQYAAQCAKCRQVFEPHCSPRIIDCTVCLRYERMIRNAALRQQKGGCGSDLTLEEFATWFGSHLSRECTYCGIPERFVPLMDFVNVRGDKVLRLGIDRIDNNKPYESGNLALACDGCNSAKSQRPMQDMEAFGPAQRLLWLTRVVSVFQQIAAEDAGNVDTRVVADYQNQLSAALAMLKNLEARLENLKDTILYYDFSAGLIDLSVPPAAEDDVA